MNLPERNGSSEGHLYIGNHHICIDGDNISIDGEKNGIREQKVSGNY